MARRGHEAQAEALEIVEGVVERMDLQLAAVAGAGIDLANRETAAELARAAASTASASAPSAASSGAGARSVSGGGSRLSRRSLRIAGPRGRDPNRSS